MRYRSSIKKSKGWMLALIIAALLISWAGSAMSQEAKKADPWADYRFLIGEWVADNPGDQGQGTCSFLLDLQDKIMVRKNHAEAPASKDRPATVHDDLMIMYLSGGAMKAAYYDSEEHLINYEVTISANRDTLVFVSAADLQVPRFRLSYVKAGEGKLAGSFEFAPPGKPDAFSLYLKWTMSRK